MPKATSESTTLFETLENEEESGFQVEGEANEMAEEGLVLALTRMSTLDLSIILADYAKHGKWNAIVKKYAIDLTGHEELKAVMDARDGVVSSL